MVFDRRRARALTLLEVVVAFGLIGFVLATATSNLGRSRSSTKGVANIVSAALSAARASAIQKGVPVALVIPSGNGAFGHSSSFYLCEGDSPRVTRVVDFSEEHPGIQLFVGNWPVDVGVLDDPTQGPTLTPPRSLKFESDFDAGRWRLPAPRDYAFIFTPSGRMYTNGLPYFDGAAHLVVTDGVSAKAGSAPGGSPGFTVSPKTFSPQQLGSPFTISLNPMGHITVSTGLKGTDGTVIVTERAPATRGAIPPGVTGAHIAPRIVSVEVEPDPTFAKGKIAPDEPITLEVKARGDGPLYGKWEASTGTLSPSEALPLEYDPKTQTWSGTWAYLAPPTAGAGDPVTLELSVTNFRGDVAPTISASSQNLTVGTSDATKMVWVRPDYSSIDTMNIDGSGKGTLFRAQGRDVTRPVWSPSGERAVIVEVYAPSEYGFRILNRDGTTVAVVPPIPGRRFSPDVQWDPLGTKIAFLTIDATMMSHHVIESDLWVMNYDGTGMTRIYDRVYGWIKRGGVPFAQFGWSPRGDRLAFHEVTSSPGYRVISTRAMLIDPDGTDVLELVPSPAKGKLGPFSPDGSQIIWHEYDAGKKLRAYTRNVDGTGGLNLLPLPDDLHEVKAWSKDGSEVLVVGRGPWHQWYRLDGTSSATRSTLNEYVRDVSSNRRYVLTHIPSPTGILYDYDNLVYTVDGTLQATLDLDVSGVTVKSVHFLESDIP